MSRPSRSRTAATSDATSGHQGISRATGASRPSTTPAGVVRTTCAVRASSPMPPLEAGQAASRPSASTSAHDVEHDAVQLEVLGGVDPRHPLAAQRLGVGVGDDAADHHRHAVEPGRPHALHHLADERQVRAREDREPDHVHRLLERRVDDLRRGQADALVDHLHAAVAGAHRDLLGAVGMAVEAGLADQELDPPPEARARRLDRGAHLREVAHRRRRRRARPRSGRGTRRRPRASPPPIRRW